MSTLRDRATAIRDEDVANTNTADRVGSLLLDMNGPTLSEIPSTDATKAGQTFFYKGEMWRYVTEGETGLAVGTPWPAKGYIYMSFYIFKNPADEVGIATADLKTNANPTITGSYIPGPERLQLEITLGINGLSGNFYIKTLMTSTTITASSARPVSIQGFRNLTDTPLVTITQPRNNEGTIFPIGTGGTFYANFTVEFYPPNA